MRVSDLSRMSGVSVATIKFYLRERLLGPGIPTGRNQALYTDAHLDRLRLIRMLVTVGGLSLATVREILDVIDAGPPTFADGATRMSPAEQAHDLLGRLGWRVSDDAPALTTIAQVIAALRQIGWLDEIHALRPHAEAADLAARSRRELTAGLPAPTAAAYSVLLDLALSALRELAWENAATAGRAGGGLSHRRPPPRPMGTR